MVERLEHRVLLDAVNVRQPLWSEQGQGPASVRTPTDILPSIDIPVISVAWQYSGMPADEMEKRVVGNFERFLTTTVNDIPRILVPTSALAFDSGGTRVWVVGADNAVRSRHVELAATTEPRWRSAAVRAAENPSSPTRAFAWPTARPSPCRDRRRRPPLLRQPATGQRGAGPGDRSLGRSAEPPTKDRLGERS
jgi:hypothetical protein